MWSLGPRGRHPDLKSRTRIAKTDPRDLKAFIERRRRVVALGLPTEPRWFDRAIEGSWSRAIAEADGRTLTRG